MGECGCTLGNQTYKIETGAMSTGVCLILELCRGCEDCDTPAGVILRKVATDGDHWHLYEDSPSLPFDLFYGQQEATIRCSLDPSVVKKRIARAVTGFPIGQVGTNCSIVSDLESEEIAEDAWEETRFTPELVKRT